MATGTPGLGGALLFWPSSWESTMVARAGRMAGGYTLDPATVLAEGAWDSAVAHGMSGRMSSARLIEVRQDDLVRWLSRSGGPEIVVPYFATFALERACARTGRRVASSAARLQWDLEDKHVFRHAAKARGIPVPEWVELPLEDASYDRAVDLLGPTFVAQAPHSSGGERTFLVRDRADWDAVDLGSEPDGTLVLCSRHIPGASVNVPVIIGDDIRTGAPSRQVIVETGGRLEFRGSEFDSGLQLTAEERDAVFSAAEWLGDQGFRGLAGVDVILDGAGGAVLEVNPRMQASTALLFALETSAGAPTILDAHVGAVMSTDVLVPLDRAPGEATQLRIRTATRGWSRALRDGVHSFDGTTLRYLRDGHGLEDLAGPDEVMVSSGPDGEGYRLDRLIARRRALAADGTLDGWWAGLEAALASVCD